MKTPSPSLPPERAEPEDGAEPRLPEFHFEQIETLPSGEPGFLRIHRRRLRARAGQGELSEPFVYDSVEREAMDAVVLVVHYAGVGERRVFLRSSLRPPLIVEASGSVSAKAAVLWELPAGLVESDEDTESGRYRCAARELEEELGFSVSPSAFSPLGRATLPTPGVMRERHYFFELEVDPAARREPSLDGSPLERHAAICAVRISTALEWCRAGKIIDAKTELGVRRLAERYSE